MERTGQTVYIVFSLMSAVCTVFTELTREEIVSVTRTEAVAGGTAKLPCDVTPPALGDKLHLVIWYKENAPIYSFDARGRTVEQAKHWSENITLGGRALFRYSDSPAKLTLESVVDSDAGVYRCRADFKKSPTRYTIVNVTVILPPERLVILDDKGEQVHYVLGPYNEGSSVNITCVSFGGRPLPRVSWWQENTLLDDTFEAVSPHRVVNTLHLQRLERRHLFSAFTCQASNNNNVSPITTAISIDINLKPLWIKLRGNNEALSSDETYEMRCEAAGARPPPVITWWKGSIPLRNTKEWTTNDGNLTVSILKFVPTTEDAGKILSCRANVPLIPDSSVEDGLKLNIYHVPTVSLHVGSIPNSTYISEGMDVYFECNIKSNPWVNNISWTHNEQVLMNNISSGILVNNQSLVLQRVTRSKAGTYTCVASNSEGDGHSNPVYLHILYKPVCKTGQQKVFGVARQEAVKVPCEVEANPTDVQFSWNFSDKKELIEIPPAHFTVDRIKSTVTYTPMTEFDYGTLHCWGKNQVGMQEVPCSFQIIPAGKPDGLNCTITNLTSESLDVYCLEGFDGGLTQNFIMEIYDVMNSSIIRTVSSDIPEFSVSGLKTGSQYNISLYAVNSKGRSEGFFLFTRMPQTQNNTDVHHLLLAASPSTLRFTPLLAILLGAAVTFLFIVLSVSIAIRIRAKNQDKIRNNKTKSEIMVNENIEGEEKDPDVIPHNSGTSDNTSHEGKLHFNKHNHIHIIDAMCDNGKSREELSAERPLTPWKHTTVQRLPEQRPLVRHSVPRESAV